MESEDQHGRERAASTVKKIYILKASAASVKKSITEIFYRIPGQLDHV
jgi:hypothetical protein